MLQFVTDTQADWQQGTLTDVVATAAGDLELANWFDDFEDTPEGDPPIGWVYYDPTDPNAVNPFTVITFDGAKRLRHAEETGTALLYADLQDTADQDLYGMVYVENTTAVSEPCARASIVGDDWVAYLGLLRFDNQTLVIWKRMNGSWTPLTSELAFNLDVNTWYRFRLQAIGTTIRFKVWEDGTPEPTSWNLTATDSDITSGKPGLRLHLTKGYFDMWEDKLRHLASGTRTSPVLDLSSVGTAASSSISWNETIPTNTSITIETNLSLDGGSTWQGWQAVANGGEIPGISAGTDLSNAKLQVRETLTTSDTTVTPQLHDLAVSVYQLFTRSQVNHVGRIAADYSRLRILDRSILGYTGQLAADVVRQQILLNRNIARTTTFCLSLRPYKLGIEWVPLGTFWSLDWDSPDDTLEAQVRARDRLELLRKSTYTPGQVQQNVSLYTLAEQVLLDAGLKPGEYIIDTALQSIIIPWAWLSPTSHREAMRIIAEAALAVVYADRDGLVRIESMGSVPQTSVLEITADDYFPPLQAPSRQDQVANEIVVTTQPLRPAAATQEVYRSTTPISVPAGQTVTVAVKFSQQPVIEAAASLDSPPAGVSIITATYYAWGAEVSIQNTGTATDSVTLVITGKPLSVQGGEQVIARDEASIMENGVLRYEFPANPLVQTLNQAQDIANALLASAKDPRRDIEVEWRGNPALELGDRVSVVNQDVNVIRQEITWAGALSARLTGRKVT